MAKKIKKGNPIEELVKGSLDYTMQQIRGAFVRQFGSNDSSDFYVAEIFSDHVIVSEWGSTSLKTDEYYKVTYEKTGDGYTFAARDDWEVVELAYQPQTADQPAAVSEKKKKGKGQRFEERLDAQASLEEAQEGKPRRVRYANAMTAGIVNGNGRRYPATVLSAAIEELNGHLHESAGQGRAVQVLGEAEHPSDKSTRRPNLLETVTKWEEVNFDGQNVDITGSILGTSKGKDILTLMEGGVMPGVSMRGYGEGKTIKENGDQIFEVTDLHITGFDLVLEPSFENAGQLIESVQEDDMNLEELLKLLKEHPEVFAGITEAQVKAMGEAQLKALEDKVRKVLGIEENANISESLKTIAEKARQFEEGQKQAAVKTAIEEACKDLPFGEKLNAQFREALEEAKPESAERVKELADAKRKEYGKLAAAGALNGMGFNERTQRFEVVGDVLENQSGTPEFARPAFELTEAMNRVEMKNRRDLRRQDASRAEILTRRILEAFDTMYRTELMREARLFQEAELTTDLNLPYSVSRAIIEEAYPDLIAANIFDVDTIATSPTMLFYETFVGETGFTATVTDEEVVAGAADAWVNMDQGRLTPGTVVVTSDPAGTTYTENTDYVIDYAAGRIKILAGGSITAEDALLVDYGYTAMRKGEMAPIERVKNQLASITITAAADRLAIQISSEALVFSRSQLGYDALARTMLNLTRQHREKVNQGLLYAALSSVYSVANNSAGAWVEGTTQDDYVELVRLIGAAKVIMGNRHYRPSYILASLERAEDLSNWDGFKRDGWPNAVLNAAGFAGGVKGLPIFSTEEFPSNVILIGNRELVQHRVFKPMIIKGPFPTYAASGDTTRLVAADQYYSEEYNVTVSPVEEKGAYVTITEGS